MQIRTGIRSMTDDVVGPTEHSVPVTSQTEISRAVEAYALTDGPGSWYELYPESASEEQLLQDMGAVGVGEADNGPAYYLLV